MSCCLPCPFALRDFAKLPRGDERLAVAFAWLGAFGLDERN